MEDAGRQQTRIVLGVFANPIVGSDLDETG